MVILLPCVKYYLSTAEDISMPNVAIVSKLACLKLEIILKLLRKQRHRLNSFRIKFLTCLIRYTLLII